MGEGMPGYVARGATLELCDQRLNDEATRPLVKQNLLATKGDLVEAVKRQSGAHTFSQSQRLHLEQHWFPPDVSDGRGDGWFEEPQAEKMAVVSQAYVAAIELAERLEAEALPGEKKRVYIQSIWSCPSQQSQFHASIVASPVQITVIITTWISVQILTSLGAAGPHERFGRAEDIWFVVPKREAHRLVVRSPGAGGDFVWSSPDELASSLRARGLDLDPARSDDRTAVCRARTHGLPRAGAPLIPADDV